MDSSYSNSSIELLYVSIVELEVRSLFVYVCLCNTICVGFHIV
jgi:hypothetical protein